MQLTNNPFYFVIFKHRFWNIRDHVGSVFNNALAAVSSRNFLRLENDTRRSMESLDSVLKRLQLPNSKQMRLTEMAKKDQGWPTSFVFA